MGTRLSQRWRVRAATLVSILAASTLAAVAPTGSAATLQSRIATQKSAAASLQSQIRTDGVQIAGTDHGLASAHARLVALQGTLDTRVGQLRNVQNELLSAREHLITLENRVHLATSALSANLVAGYEGAKPNLVTVVLSSHGFGQLLEQVGFLRTVGHQDATILHITRIARRAVSDEAVHLAGLESRDRSLAETVLGERNQVAALQSALAGARIRELGARARSAGRLAAVQGHLGALQHALHVQEVKAAEAATRAAQTGNANVGGIAVDTSGMVQPPAGAPLAVRQMIAAGNAIATLPYIWGGGHNATFSGTGYDCSGSVSYVLAAAGLLSAPEVSGDFTTYGDPGPGQWVTIYASYGHVWMTIAGWRFDTVALAEDGSRWSQGGGEFAGFVERHPPGL